MAMFLIVKKDPATGKIITVYESNGIDLGKHIVACYTHTNLEVLSVTKLD